MPRTRAQIRLGETERFETCAHGRFIEWATANLYLFRLAPLLWHKDHGPAETATDPLCGRPVLRCNAVVQRYGAKYGGPFSAVQGNQRPHRSWPDAEPV